MSMFVISRDARGALVHVRTAEGECVGCIEVGLFEIVRMVIAEETARAVEGSPAPTASQESVDRNERISPR